MQWRSQEFTIGGAYTHPTRLAYATDFYATQHVILQTDEHTHFSDC